jgi:crotonobetainyl-CoA:carnitine CoA-transferase CaiB-like acyl-CoA transferase
MDGQRFGTRIDIPQVGEHTREVLKSVGYGDAEVEKMISGKVVAAGAR